MKPGFLQGARRFVEMKNEVGSIISMKAGVPRTAMLAEFVERFPFLEQLADEDEGILLALVVQEIGRFFAGQMKTSQSHRSFPHLL